MGKDNTKLDFTGQDIYVGIDTGKKSWKVTILTAEFEHNTFTQPPKPDVLVNYLHKNFPGALAQVIIVSMRLDTSASGFMMLSNSKE